MATDYLTKILDYTVNPCPRCGEAHTFKLKVTKKIVIFGGGGRTETLITFICPKTQQPFRKTVPNPGGGEIEGLASSSDIDIEHASHTTRVSSMEIEFEEWIKNSRTVALDFCKTMI